MYRPASSLQLGVLMFLGRRENCRLMVLSSDSLRICPSWGQHVASDWSMQEDEGQHPCLDSKGTRVIPASELPTRGAEAQFLCLLPAIFLLPQGSVSQSTPHKPYTCAAPARNLSLCVMVNLTCQPSYGTQEVGQTPVWIYSLWYFLDEISI